MPSLDRQYKFRADWEGSQYWTDPITIIPHEVNEIDMDLDLLGFDLTGDRLYVNNRSKGKKIQLAMVGLPYGLFVSSVIAAPSVSETIYYYHNDHLGTPQVLTDDNAQVVWKADYKPFGEVDIVVETVENNFRFPGQYYDEETGLHYNYHRYYHSDIGRYLRADPIGLIGGTNLYAYCLNNPIILTDPNGLKMDWLCFAGCLSGIIVGGLPFFCEWCVYLPPPANAYACAICAAAVTGTAIYVCVIVCDKPEEKPKKKDKCEKVPSPPSEPSPPPSEPPLGLPPGMPMP